VGRLALLCVNGTLGHCVMGYSGTEGGWEGAWAVTVQIPPVQTSGALCSAGRQRQHPHPWVRGCVRHSDMDFPSVCRGKEDVNGVCVCVSCGSCKMEGVPMMVKQAGALGGTRGAPLQ
jgi:hypothetical protein